MNERNNRLLDSIGRRNRKHADKPCQHCGKIFRPLHAKSKYCSRPCMWVNNGPRKVRQEHESRWHVSAKGYVQGYVWINGKFVHYKKHRWIMEQHLGRKLSTDEDVHHINGDKLDNRLENLIVMLHGQHSTLTNYNRHQRAALRKARGEG